MRVQKHLSSLVGMLYLYPWYQVLMTSKFKGFDLSFPQVISVVWMVTRRITSPLRVWVRVQSHPRVNLKAHRDRTTRWPMLIVVKCNRFDTIGGRHCNNKKKSSQRLKFQLSQTHFEGIIVKNVTKLALNSGTKLVDLGKNDEFTVHNIGQWFCCFQNLELKSNFKHVFWWYEIPH